MLTYLLLQNGPDMGVGGVGGQSEYRPGQGVLVWPVDRWKNKAMHTCEHICPPHACAVMPWGGRLLNSSLAWDGAVMMPLQDDHYSVIVFI